MFADAFSADTTPLSGKNFDHRKQWLEERFTFLARFFAIDVLGFAILSNHLKHPNKEIEAALKYAESNGLRHAIRRTTPTRFGGTSTSARISQPSEQMNQRFTFILSGVSEITPDLADAIYGATGGDIEFNMRDGVAFLEFDRAAASLHDAITSAISQVEGSGVGVRVVRVESDDANTIAKINADLLGVTSGS